MKTALQKFEVAYLSYLEQTRKLIEAQKQTPPIDKSFDGDFAAFNNSEAATHVRERVNPIREKIQDTVKEIDELIPYVYPINDDEVNDWIKSEIRCFCGIEKNNFIRCSGCPSEHPRTARLVERINKQPLLGMLAQAYPEQ